MDSLATRIFIRNWPRKLVSILIAFIIWIFINHSIVITRTIPNISVRVINLPPDKTINGLLPNGILNKRVTLTLTGTKDILNELEPGDIEVLIDASLVTQDQWVVNITKRNLMSLNPSINLTNNITKVSHSELIIKLSKLLTEKIPINIPFPAGSPLEGYECLDIWPNKLWQTVTGPEEEVQRLKQTGLTLTINLNDIPENKFKELAEAQKNKQNNEFSYFVPDNWKKVQIPYRYNIYEEINDPHAKELRIDFLRKEFLPLELKLPIEVFYPEKYSKNINPYTHILAIEDPVQEENGITVFSPPLYIKDVSRLFLDIIRDYMQIAIIAAPIEERERLQWSIQILSRHALEDIFTAYQLSNYISKNQDTNLIKERENLLRKRFRLYMHRLILYTTPDQKLNLESVLTENQIKILKY